MIKVNLTFRMHQLAQATPAQIETALNQFEATIGKTLPQDYRQHMLTYNGGIVEQDNIEHKDHTEDGGGLSFTLYHMEIIPLKKLMPMI